MIHERESEGPVDSSTLALGGGGGGRKEITHYYVFFLSLSPPDEKENNRKQIIIKAKYRVGVFYNLALFWGDASRLDYIGVCVCVSLKQRHGIKCKPFILYLWRSLGKENAEESVMPERSRSERRKQSHEKK